MQALRSAGAEDFSIRVYRWKKAESKKKTPGSVQQMLILYSAMQIFSLAGFQNTLFEVTELLKGYFNFYFS